MSEKLEYYGQKFRIFSNNPYPTKAQTWKSVEQCKEQYEEFLADCDKWDQIPLTHWLYEGKPDGNEEIYGYPDYPDYVLIPNIENPLECIVRKL